MSQVATVTPLRPRDFNGSQLALIKRTVASDCDATEFDLFMEVSRRVGLDPFRRQIYAVVYNKGNAEKRKMSIIVGIDGFRAVAARNRDYRPDEDPPEFTIKPELKSETNPLGLDRAVVRCHKLAPNGEWHKLVGVAYWDEFVPLKEAWEYDEAKGKKAPTGRMELDKKSKWYTMPRVMLAKVAEAQALRRGWPEDLSGIYAPEELDRAEVIDATASEVVQSHERDERTRLIGGRHNIAMLWNAGEALDAVPLGKLADRCLEFIRKAESPTQLEAWRNTNKVSLQMFWAEAKSDALEVKKALEARIAELSQP
jgi:phage recombination protein Bet